MQKPIQTIVVWTSRASIMPYSALQWGRRGRWWCCRGFPAAHQHRCESPTHRSPQHQLMSWPFWYPLMVGLKQKIVLTIFNSWKCCMWRKKLEQQYSLLSSPSCLFLQVHPPPPPALKKTCWIARRMKDRRAMNLPQVLREFVPRNLGRSWLQKKSVHVPTTHSANPKTWYFTGRCSNRDPELEFGTENIPVPNKHAQKSSSDSDIQTQKTDGKPASHHNNPSHRCGPGRRYGAELSSSSPAHGDPVNSNLWIH